MFGSVPFGVKPRRSEDLPSFPGAWVMLAALLAGFGAVLALPPLIVFPGFMLAVILVAWAWNRYALHSLYYSRTLSHSRSFPGETFELNVSLENRKLLPLGWLNVEDEFPLVAQQVGGDLIAASSSPDRGLLTQAFSLRWFERVSRTYIFRAEKRGIYILGPARLKSGDPFNIYDIQTTVSNRTWLVIYPRVVSLPDLGLPSRNPFGDRRAQRRLFEDPNRVAGAREARPGDSFRQVHWKATARRQELQVKVYEPTTSHSLVLCLNVATFAKHWQGIDAELLEWAITVTASLATWAVEQRYPVGLISNGCQAHSDQPLRLLPGQTPEHLAGLLELLAGVSSFVLLPLDKLLLRESPALPWGATLVVVTAVITDELRATLVRLREAGRRLALVNVGGQPTGELIGVVAYEVPEKRTVSHGL